MTLYLTDQGIYTTILSAMRSKSRTIRRVWFDAQHKARTNYSLAFLHGGPFIQFPREYTR